MTRLSHHEWDRIHQFCLELHADPSPEHFFRSCVEALPQVLGVRWAAWQWMDEEFQFVDHTVSGEFSDQVPLYTEAMMQTMQTHPVVQHVHEAFDGDCTHTILAMSDFLSQRQLKDRGIYAEAYRHLEINDQVYTELQFSNQIRAGITINAFQPFTGAQRQMTEMIKQHLILAYRNLLQANPDLGPASLRENPLVESLSPRLRQVKERLMAGLPRKAIADQMGLSLHTVNDYVKELYAHYNVHSHAELMVVLNGSSRSGLL